ncbi:MAG: nitroreductase family protein [Bacteroidales bacterium]|nr:nitroreductase family protein [Bacteroidales bacterium]
MLQELINLNRSCRRFYEDEKITEETLISLIELARISPSPRNQQALKFILINDVEMNKKIFPLLGWAAAIPDWDGPIEGERPAAYIIIIGDNSIIEKGKKTYHEVASGIAAQSIMLGAAEKGIGGCMIAAIKRKPLREILNLPEKFEILLVPALGKPKEKIVIEEMPENGNYDYWRDEDMVHHVPKRSLEEIIVDYS